MSLRSRLRNFLKQRAAAKNLAKARVLAQRQNAELELALDDFAFDGRLPKDTQDSEYRSAFSDGWEDDDAEPRKDW